MKHELKPIAEPFPEHLVPILDSYPKRDGYLLQLFRVFANSERFLKKGTLNLLDRDSPLPMREREIIILRVCANSLCEYEWGVHVTAFAEHVGLSDEQVAATQQPLTEVSCWTAEEKLLITVVDQLCREKRIDDTAYERFQCIWNQEQQLEIFALIGNYHTIAFVANSVKLPLEPFAARFSDYRL